MSEAAVEVAHVSKSYHRGGTTVPVLDDINLVNAPSVSQGPPAHGSRDPSRSGA